MAGGCLWASTHQMTPIRHPHVSPSCYLSQQISDMAYNFSETGENATVLKVTTWKERHRGALEFCWAAIGMCLACLEVAHFRGKIKSLFLDINIYIRGWQIFPPPPLVCPSFLFFLWWLKRREGYTLYPLKCSRIYTKCSDSQVPP